LIIEYEELKHKKQANRAYFLCPFGGKQLA